LSVVPLASCLLTGCIFEPNLHGVRVSAQQIGWTGADLGKIAASGESTDVEIALGTDADPMMGPLFVGFAYSYGWVNGRLPGRTREHRAGIRFRSSILEGKSQTCPYAATGAFLGYMDSEGEPVPWKGLGIEGGFGVRIGLAKLAVDLDMMMSWVTYESWYNAASTRFGVALFVGF